MMVLMKRRERQPVMDGEEFRPLKPNRTDTDQKCSAPGRLRVDFESPFVTGSALLLHQPSQVTLESIKRVS